MAAAVHFRRVIERKRPARSILWLLLVFGLLAVVFYYLTVGAK